jgi:HEAT repeat protein
MAIADDPLPDLTARLRHPLADHRARAARGLGKLGWLAREALNPLVAVLQDKDAGVREAAAQAVGQMGPDALPHLVAMLRHEDKYVRRNAVWALGRIGPLAKAAVPDLTAALTDPDPRTAGGAAQALGNMGTDAADAVTALTAAMRGTNIVLCRMAAKALSQIGRPALQALITHLQHRDPFVRGEAALAVGWMGPPAAAAVPGLVEMLKAARPVPVGRLQGPINRTPPTAVTTTPPPTTEDSSRANAAQALGRIGPAAATAMDLLARVAADPYDPARGAAELAVRQVRGG